MAIPELVKSLVEPWSSLYESSKALISLARFMHLGGLLLGGGAAVTFDRASIHAAREGPAFRSHHLAMLRRVHRVVIGGFVLIALSGLMMLAADLEAFAASRLFWIKMLLVVLLAANGFAITRIERTLRPETPSGWTALGVTSRISLVLWFAIVLAGTVLVLVA
jgi:uncharacterized membrane protein